MSGNPLGPTVVIHISPQQKRQLLAGLAADAAVFNLADGSFYVPALSHVLFAPIVTPDHIRPINVSVSAANERGQ